MHERQKTPPTQWKCFFFDTRKVDFRIYIVKNFATKKKQIKKCDKKNIATYAYELH